MCDNYKNLLFVVTGPTASGKTSKAVALAKHLEGEIISADSRQIYRNLPIGTACPTADELAAVPHHFINILDLDQYYSAAQFESDVLELLPQLFAKHDYVVMCGGSMMYVDAVCNGLDNIPTVSDELRAQAYPILENEGLEGVSRRVAEIDPEYYAIADKQNAKRLVHALEIYMHSGKTFSSFRTGAKKQRPFHIHKFVLNMPREELFARINSRVDKMVELGLERLTDEKPFFIMCEGGSTDWAAHLNRTMPTINCIIEFDEAIKTAYKFYLQHPDETLIVVTADHGTGGVSLGCGGWGRDKVHWDIIEKAWTEAGMCNEMSLEENKELNESATIGWSGVYHTGEHVPVFAIGKGAEKFHGIIENTDIKGKILGE